MEISDQKKERGEVDKESAMPMIRIEKRDDGVAIVWLDSTEKPVNTLTPAAVAEFNDLVLPHMDDDGIRAFVVASAKGDTFIAGADLDVIEGLDA